MHQQNEFYVDYVDLLVTRQQQTEELLDIELIGDNVDPPMQSMHQTTVKHALIKMKQDIIEEHELASH